MEPFIVSARKYRPQTFKDVVGQSSITNTLTNAIEHNHLAQALLFCGPRGVGKTTCARILAKKINQDGTEREDEDFAFNIFELDAASNNSVDDIRSLIDQVRIPPQTGKYKVYIIDEVHMLSQSAFNAFLKTLEEPPKHAIFILATTEKHKIIPTILSRCQIFDFKRITVKDAAEYLKHIAEQQGIEAEESALHIIAQKADGAMRDALSIFDRVVSFSGKELTRKAVTENLNVLDYDIYFTATDLILENNIPELLILFNKTLSLGFDGHHFITGLASHFRDLMVCQHPDTLNLLEVGEDVNQQYQNQAKKASKEFLLKAIDMANDCDLKYKTSKNQRLLVELTLMKLASITFDGEKKNSNFIIPASHFVGNIDKSNGKASPPSNNKVTTPKVEKPALEQYTSKEPIKEASEPEKAKEELVSEPQEGYQPKKINIKTPEKRVSGLSLSSIKVKKEHENTKSPNIAEEDLPKDAFQEKDMQKHWDDFVHQLEKQGRKILASNLQTDVPKLKNENTIWIELPNGTMKKEIEREQSLMLDYLKQKLNNYSISLHITVNEEVAKKFAFTPEEKYEKLREKNPNLDLLRKEFDLDFLNLPHNTSIFAFTTLKNVFMLGLKLPTDPRWVNIVEKNIEEILTDHAYCEQKAASTAISLIIGFPEKSELVKEMTALAREEMGHFNMVHDKIINRGWVLGRERKDEYVIQLMKFFPKGGSRETHLVHKLLYAALIEARSCERFRLLSEEIADEELSEFYRNLMVSEANHYTMFLKFARKYGNKEEVDQKWNDLLEYEAQLMKDLGKKETMHG